MDCVLCEILKNEKDRIVYQDDFVFVAMNIEPLKPEHVMVMPVRHVEECGDLTPDEALVFLKLLDRTAKAVAKASGTKPTCVVNGHGHRTQAHLHAHVLPTNCGLRGLFVKAEGSPERKRLSPPELARLASRLREIF